MQQFRVLEIWKRAHALVLEVYRQTAEFPNHEVPGLTLQLRRSATAIATRIAEGCSRDVDAEFLADLRRAKASATELEYMLIVAKDLGYGEPAMHDKLAEDVVTLRKMIHSFLRRL